MHRAAAIAGLTLGLMIALGANLTYAIPRGPVTVGLGLIAPLVLPVALYIRTTFTADSFWQRLPRELATLAVAGPAAAISYVHTYELVLSVNEPWILAVLAPLSSDGLAGMATLALHRHRQADQKTQAHKPRSRRENPSPPAATAPTSEREVTSIDQPRGRRAAGLEWARNNWPCTGGQIHKAVGVSKSEADRIRAWVKNEKERAS